MVCWTGILAVTALALTRFWRSPHLAHALWLLVLIKLVTPPMVPLPLGGFMAAGNEASMEEGLAAVRALRPAEPLSHGEYASTISPAMDPLLPAVDVVVSLRREGGLWDGLLDTWRVWLLAAWGMGSVLFVGVVLRRHMRLLSLTADSRTPDAALAEDATRLSRRLSLARCPLVRITAAHVCPFVTPGARGPMIVLPSRLLAELNRDQVNSILVHELAHIRRRGPLGSPVRGLRAGVELVESDRVVGEPTASPGGRRVLRCVGRLGHAR